MQAILELVVPHGFKTFIIKLFNLPLAFTRDAPVLVQRYEDLALCCLDL